MHEYGGGAWWAREGRLVYVELADQQLRTVAPDANPYMVMLSVFKTGLEGSLLAIDNLRGAERYLPDNIYDAIRLFKSSKFVTDMLGEEVHGRYADVKLASAERCPKALGSQIKTSEVQFHHEVTNQYLWSKF